MAREEEDKKNSEKADVINFWKRQLEAKKELTEMEQKAAEVLHKQIAVWEVESSVQQYIWFEQAEKEAFEEPTTNPQH